MCGSLPHFLTTNEAEDAGQSYLFGGRPKHRRPILGILFLRVEPRADAAATTEVWYACGIHYGFDLVRRTKRNPHRKENFHSSARLRPFGNTFAFDDCLCFSFNNRATSWYRFRALVGAGNVLHRVYD